MGCMQTSENGPPAYAPEILATLRRSRFLLMGFERIEFIRIADVLSSAGAIVAQVSSEPRTSESCHAMLASIPALAEIGRRQARVAPLLIVGTPDDIVKN